VVGMVEASGLRFRVKIGDFEVELSGDYSYVKEQYENLLSKILEQVEFSGLTLERQGKTGRRSYKRSGETSQVVERLTILKDEGFFNEPKRLKEIRDEMARRGWYHNQDVIQQAILKHFDKHGIRRIGTRGSYRYVKS